MVVSRDQGVSYARERYGISPLALAAVALRRVLIESNLDRRPKLRVVEGLRKVTERLGDGSAPQRGSVHAGRRQIDNRDLARVPNPLTGRWAVQRPLECDVHQHEIGPPVRGHSNR